MNTLHGFGKACHTICKQKTALWAKNSEKQTNFGLSCRKRSLSLLLVSILTITRVATGRGVWRNLLATSPWPLLPVASPPRCSPVLCSLFPLQLCGEHAALFPPALCQSVCSWPACFDPDCVLDLASVFLDLAPVQPFVLLFARLNSCILVFPLQAKTL